MLHLKTHVAPSTKEFRYLTVRYGCRSRLLSPLQTNQWAGVTLHPTIVLLLLVLAMTHRARRHHQWAHGRPAAAHADRGRGGGGHARTACRSRRAHETGRRARAHLPACCPCLLTVPSILCQSSPVQSKTPEWPAFTEHLAQTMTMAMRLVFNMLQPRLFEFAGTLRFSSSPQATKGQLLGL